MTLEHEQPPLIRRVGKILDPKSLVKAVETIPSALAVRMFLWRVEKNIVRPIVPEFPEGFDNAFRKAMRDKDITPILISSHQGHADIISIAIVSKRLTDLLNETANPSDRFPGFLVPIAASLETGNQGVLLKQGIKQAKKRYLPKYFLDTAPYVREKDKKLFALDSNNIRFMRKLLDSIKKGFGIGLFPEATVEGGRSKNDDRTDIKGMQKIDFAKFNEMITLVNRCGKKPLFIPIGSRGAFRIVHPEHTQKFTFEAWEAILPFFETGSLMSIKVGMPIGYDQVVEGVEQQKEEPTPEKLSYYLGRKIAELLPENERGVYA